MSTSGPTDTQPVPDSESQVESRGCSPPLWLILVALVVLVFSLIFGVQLFGVLVGFVFPPGPPLPADVAEVEHENIGHGVDRWLYEAALDPCQLISFYEDAGSVCIYADNLCGADGEYVSSGFRRDEAATCTGQDTFSIFGLLWDVEISTLFRAGEEITRFEITRLALWGGPPLATSTPQPTP